MKGGIGNLASAVGEQSRRKERRPEENGFEEKNPTTPPGIGSIQESQKKKHKNPRTENS